MISAICGIITVVITKNIKLNNNFIQLILNGIIVVIVPNLLQYLIFRKREEFEYTKSMVINMLQKGKQK